jgi:hypothetical protein
MNRDVFISYSTRDREPAFALSRALGASGVNVFIAEENLKGGTGWAGELVDEIRSCKLLLLLFSKNANDSPQVLREVQAAIKYRVPVMPVRIDDTEPTRDMEYFLGTTHWHDARQAPFADRLPAVISSAQDLLRGERSPWRLVQRYTDRRLAIGLGVVAILLTSWSLLRGPFGMFASMPDPMKKLRGVWELTNTPGCYVRIDGGLWSSGGKCPAAWSGGGNFQAGEGEAEAAAYGGKGDGFFFVHANNGNLMGVWRRSLFGGSLTLVEQAGTEWRFESADDDDFPDPSRDVLKQSGHPWPLTGLPDIAAKATAVARRDWQADAVLTTVRLRGQNGVGNIGTSNGAKSLEFEFVSPAKRLTVTFAPYSPFGIFSSERRYTGRQARGLPAAFLDLPAAIAADSEHSGFAQELELAELQDYRGTTWGRVQLNSLAWLLRWSDGNVGISAEIR